MKNLNELGVQEMDAIELKKIDGGGETNDRPLGRGDYGSEGTGGSTTDTTKTSTEDLAWYLFWICVLTD